MRVIITIIDIFMILFQPTALLLRALKLYLMNEILCDDDLKLACFKVLHFK